MGDTCPHCGVRLGTMRDAFCFECRNRLDEPPEPVRQVVGPADSLAPHPVPVPPTPLPWWLAVAAVFGYGECGLYNRTGYLLIGICFGLAALIGYVIGDTRSNTVLLIGGPIATGADVAVRSLWSLGYGLFPDRGGRFFILPLWLFGLIWLALGLLRGNA